MALEQLLAYRTTMDFCCRQLELDAELVVCLNDAQAPEAIKEAVMHHQSTACAL